jgi:deoxyribodipyrimidine photolyase
MQKMQEMDDYTGQFACSSSYLSGYLKFGCVSVAEVYLCVAQVMEEDGNRLNDLLKDVKLLELDMHDKEKALEVFDNKQN